MFCPTCAAKQIETKLVLHQINFDEAVYLCENRKCTYPEGYSWIFVKRKWTDMKKDQQEPLSNSENTNEQTEADDLERLLNSMLCLPQNSAENENRNVDVGFDFDEFEQLLSGEKVESQIGEIVDVEEIRKTNSNKDVKINALSDVHIGVPLSDNSVDEIESNSHQKPVEAQSINTPISIPNSIISATLEIQKSSIESLEAEAFEEQQNKNPSIVIDGTTKNEKIINKALSTDEALKCSLRRSNRIKNSIQSAEKQALPYVKNKSKTIDKSQDTASFKVSSELREKLLKTKQLQQQKKIVTDDFELNSKVVDFLKSLPHSK